MGAGYLILFTGIASSDVERSLKKKKNDPGYACLTYHIHLIRCDLVIMAI